MFRVNGFVLFVRCLACLWSGRGGWAVIRFNGRSVGLYKGVKDDIAVYHLRVIAVIVFNGFSMDMEFLYCVQMCSFFVIVYYFHDLVHGVK